MTCKAEEFHAWFIDIYRQGPMPVQSCTISVGPVSLTYTLVVDGKLSEPEGIPPGSESFIKSASVTYPPIREANWIYSAQREAVCFRKGPPFTTFVYEIYLEEFKQ